MFPVRQQEGGRAESLLTDPWNTSTPEKAGFNTANSHLRGYVYCALCAWCFLRLSLLFYKFTLTPEVKKLVFIVVDFIKFSFFFLITEGKDTES